MANKKLFLIKPRLKSDLDPKTYCIPGESLEEFAALQTECFDRFAPADIFEKFEVDMLIESGWQLRRFRRIEAILLQMPKNDKTDLSLMRLQRLMASHTRSNKQTVAQIERFQRSRRKEMAALQCQPHVM
jgi:hypothetical protein